MNERIQVSKDAFKAFEEEVVLAMETPTRTLRDVVNKDVLTLLNNPGKEIEIVDPKNWDDI